ncbi:MAG TPA: STAS domain-containing protein [Marinospirillum sp.]|uniref:STAS domain-containing protein n=1 Tax=Marinospirillum sp. TaxID=2183934 RepID=UPI002B45DF6A|nr:STAS domain-containing protein [Marinospirillum sp.]HKM15156.1 STAS domain-containing protein [Marinospirillum sp.]
MHTGKLLSAKSQQTFVLKLIGDVRLTLCSTLDTLLERIFVDKDINNFVIDLSKTENLDSTTLGLLAKIALQASNHGLAQPSIISPNEDITVLLESMGFRQYFILLKHPLTTSQELQEVPQLAGSEEHIKAQILDAHLTLMSMNEQNKEAFKNVVQVLEECSDLDCQNTDYH